MNPQVVDYNEDGMLDLIVGDADGFVNYFRRTGAGINALASRSHIYADKPGDDTRRSAIDVGERSAPFIVDWNEDGLIDLLVGREELAGGSMWLYLNSGSAGKPFFTTYSAIKVGGSLYAGYHSVPHVIDLDQDGRKDIVVGTVSTHIVYLKNTGTNATPSFSNSVKLEAEGIPISFPGYKWNTTPCVVDWNNDGHLDILTGNTGNNIYLFMASPVAVQVEEILKPLEKNSFTVIESPDHNIFTFSLNLEEQCEVKVLIYSMDGRLVKTLDYGLLSVGQSIHYASSDHYSAGIYMVVANLGNSGVATKRLMLLR